MSDGKVEVAVIGDRDSVLGFSALGVAVMTPAPDKVREAVVKAVKDEVMVLFITERMAETVSDLLEDLSERPFPTVVTIPDASGSMGLGLKKLDDIIVRAVGSHISSKEDEEETG
ncbi:MAG: V-type ATP synthase subunit F [Deltaproteobacteria bacterium]|uniref:V-type ATP synthase subunit F n=1 Tax=Candidatus Zymogenus saltonus TaxID=2844893 RepID=A0A9D8KF69_9DELT|nr:V-type ATP synthase subunit F [Candidatus Zymogenus saltonus]